ncbi:MAG: winged helix-turn-helix domain-containing protein [Candidatus Bathyarchaeales archaeon]
MRRSKLEMYEAVLGALVRKPLGIDRIAFETNMDCSILRQRLDFLMENGLVEERISGHKTVYALTERGVTVLKTLSFQKYFEKVANTIRMMDEALQVLPSLTSNRGNEKANNAKEE